MVALTTLLFLATSISTCLAAPAKPSHGKRSSPPTATMSGGNIHFADGTYPRANFLSDGTILGVYAANSIISTVKNFDGTGISWQPLGQVDQGPANENDIDNPYVLQLKSGRILCAYRNHSKDPATGAYTFFRITISYSDDKGQSWTYLSTPASDPGPVNGNWEPFMRLAQDGTTIQIFYSRENSALDQDTLQRFSTDDGLTWSTANTITGADTTSTRDGMTGVACTSGSSLIAVFESESNGLFVIDSITSSDDGKTWGNRQNVYTPDQAGTSAGAPQVVSIGSSLAVSFMTNEDTSTPDPSGGYTSDTSVKVVTSGDGGVTWGSKILVTGVQSVWAGLLGLTSCSFMVLVDYKGAKAQLITLS